MKIYALCKKILALYNGKNYINKYGITLTENQATCTLPNEITVDVLLYDEKYVSNGVSYEGEFSIDQANYSVRVLFNESKLLVWSMLGNVTSDYVLTQLQAAYNLLQTVNETCEEESEKCNTLAQQLMEL